MQIEISFNIFFYFSRQTVIRNSSSFSVLKYYAEEEFSTLFQQDGVHLSERGYDYLYDSIFYAITRIVDRNGILK